MSSNHHKLLGKHFYGRCPKFTPRLDSSIRTRSTHLEISLRWLFSSGFNCATGFLSILDSQLHSHLAHSSVIQASTTNFLLDPK